MVYFENRPALQYITVPKGVLPAEGPLTLSLWSTVGLGVRWSDEVRDLGGSRISYRFAVAIGREGDYNLDYNEDYYTWVPLDSGEYQYSLTDADGTLLAGGVAVIGDYRTPGSPAQIDNEIRYEQYND